MAARETTFRNFTPEQAAAYARGRGDVAYPAPLYQAIIDYHQGERKTVLDVGTGPGNAARDLLSYFDQVIGCDAGVSMIEQATKGASTGGYADRAKFVVSPAEECAHAVADAGFTQVDAITVATAAHWFDMPAFYESAAKVLRPGGTLAMWCPSSLYCHPSMPKHEELQALLSELEDEHLARYMQAGSKIARSAYKDLVLPWSQDSTTHLFDSSSLVRRDWDLNGIPSAPPSADGSPGPYLLGRKTTLAEVRAAFSASSPVIRWREAHPDKANTEEDVIEILLARVQELVPNVEDIIVAPSLSLLLLRRS